MTDSVFDASALIKLVIGEDGSPAALNAYRAATRVIVPDWSLLEVASAVRKRIARTEVTADEGRGAVAAVRRLDLHDVPGSDFADAAFEMALTTGAAVYDCLYIAVAEDAAAQLVTADRRQAVAARNRGVDVLTIEAGNP